MLYPQKPQLIITQNTTKLYKVPAEKPTNRTLDLPYAHFHTPNNKE